MPKISHSPSISAEKDITGKAEYIRSADFERISSAGYRSVPDSRFVSAFNSDAKLLSDCGTILHGQNAGDNSLFNRVFWEVSHFGKTWQAYQLAPEQMIEFSGRTQIVRWEEENGMMARLAESVRHLNHKAQQWRSGKPNWGKRGVAVSLVGRILGTLYDGQIYGVSCGVIIPKKETDLAAIWQFVRSGEFETRLREIDSGLAISVKTVLAVPFDLARWQKVAAESYPHGLPKPFSSDPTQWIFSGYPAGADQPLHVAVARLLGYRWPRQTGSEFPDCPALDPDGLESHADADGIACLPPINREAPAAVRLRALLAAAFGADWTNGTERDLLAATGAKQTNLEDWLQDAFFEQHCKLFHNRPFVWHLWDGRKDGFHALVNYHRLDRANLEKLTYSYLGDWIRQQDADAKADKPGAAERLGAARALETELVAILEGEPPYDLFIRWKPLAEQPLGWQPDINDGVRLNIRLFMQARDLGKKGAGVLRAKPNTKWDKDRGTEPHRDKSDYPWFWHAEEPPLACPGGPEFTGNRWNNVHLTLARKRAARRNGG